MNGKTLLQILFLNLLIGSVMAQPFSFEEVTQATKNFEVKQPAFLSAQDGIQLAYYAFIPQASKALIIFYHGGGTWSKAMYQLMAQETSQHYHMAVYLFDIRGHGHSQGPRGDTPSAQHVWDDIDVVLNFVKKQYPHLPLLLAGHSSALD
jgi:acylglycerol lipase